MKCEVKLCCKHIPDLRHNPLEGETEEYSDPFEDLEEKNELFQVSHGSVHGETSAWFLS